MSPSQHALYKIKKLKCTIIYLKNKSKVRFKDNTQNVCY